MQATTHTQSLQRATRLVTSTTLLAAAVPGTARAQEQTASAN
jgi:hypothetical protein